MPLQTPAQTPQQQEALRDLTLLQDQPQQPAQKAPQQLLKLLQAPWTP
jgi:hypothetical protein